MMSKQARLNISRGKKGKIPYWKSHLWIGHKAKYDAKHDWAARHLNDPKKCVRCGVKNIKKLEWANISQKYFRVFTDWIRLCKSCHRQWDWGKIALVIRGKLWKRPLISTYRALRKDSKSPYVGVSYKNEKGRVLKWCPYVVHGRKRINLGVYKTALEARKVRKRYLKYLDGEIKTETINFKFNE